MYSLLGDLDRAIDLLMVALPHAQEVMRTWLANDSDLDPLRAHPRFLALLRRLETEP